MFLGQAVEVPEGEIKFGVKEKYTTPTILPTGTPKPIFQSFAAIPKAWVEPEEAKMDIGILGGPGMYAIGGAVVILLIINAMR